MSEPADVGIYNIDQKYDNKESKKKKQKRSQEPDPAVFIPDGADIKSLHPIKLCFVGSDQLAIVLLGYLVRGGICCLRSGLQRIVGAADSGHNPVK